MTGFGDQGGDYSQFSRMGRVGSNALESAFNWVNRPGPNPKPNPFVRPPVNTGEDPGLTRPLNIGTNGGAAPVGMKAPAPAGGSFGAPGGGGDFGATGPVPDFSRIPQARVGVPGPSGRGFRSVVVAQAQVPRGGFENEGDPGHQLHPLLKSVLGSPASSMAPQYWSRTVEQAPYAPNHFAPWAQPGMREFESSAHAAALANQGQHHMAPALAGPSGPSQADLVMQAIHAQAGLAHARGQAELAHGHGQKLLAESKNLASIPEDGAPMENAMKLQQARQGITQENPLAKYPILSGIRANPGANIGMFLRGMRAEGEAGVDPYGPEGLSLMDKIIAMQGWDLNQLEGENARPSLFPWSPESRGNYEYIQKHKQFHGHQ